MLVVAKDVWLPTMRILMRAHTHRLKPCTAILARNECSWNLNLKWNWPILSQVQSLLVSTVMPSLWLVANFPKAGEFFRSIVWLSRLSHQIIKKQLTTSLPPIKVLQSLLARSWLWGKYALVSPPVIRQHVAYFQVTETEISWVIHNARGQQLLCPAGCVCQHEREGESAQKRVYRRFWLCKCACIRAVLCQWAA